MSLSMERFEDNLVLFSIPFALIGGSPSICFNSSSSSASKNLDVLGIELGVDVRVLEPGVANSAYYNK